MILERLTSTLWSPTPRKRSTYSSRVGTLPVISDNARKVLMRSCAGACISAVSGTRSEPWRRHRTSELPRGVLFATTRGYPLDTQRTTDLVLLATAAKFRDRGSRTAALSLEQPSDSASLLNVVRLVVRFPDDSAIDLQSRSPADLAVRKVGAQECGCSSSGSAKFPPLSPLMLSGRKRSPRPLPETKTTT